MPLKRIHWNVQMVWPLTQHNTALAAGGAVGGVVKGVIDTAGDTVDALVSGMSGTLEGIG